MARTCSTLVLMALVVFAGCGGSPESPEGQMRALLVEATSCSPEVLEAAPRWMRGVSFEDSADLVVQLVGSGTAVRDPARRAEDFRWLAARSPAVLARAMNPT